MVAQLNKMFPHASLIQKNIRLPSADKTSSRGWRWGVKPDSRGLSPYGLKLLAPEYGTPYVKSPSTHASTVTIFYSRCIIALLYYSTVTIRKLLDNFGIGSAEAKEDCVIARAFQHYYNPTHPYSGAN